MQSVGTEKMAFHMDLVLLMFVPSSLKSNSVHIRYEMYFPSTEGANPVYSISIRETDTVRTKGKNSTTMSSKSVWLSDDA